MTELTKAWSYSALTAFETCPRQFYEVRVAKNIPYTQGPEAAWGDRVHKALENYAKNGTPMPEDMPYKAVADSVLTRLNGGKLLVEYELPITNNFAQCGWWDKTVWCRGKADIGVLWGDKLFIGDYKTGKVKDDFVQMRLFAALGMAHFPEVETVKTAYFWLKNKSITPHTVTRAELPVIWSEFLPRVEAFQRAHDKDEWPCKSSGLCKAHCPVIKCQHNGKRT